MMHTLCTQSVQNQPVITLALSDRNAFSISAQRRAQPRRLTALKNCSPSGLIFFLARPRVLFRASLAGALIHPLMMTPVTTMTPFCVNRYTRARGGWICRPPSRSSRLSSGRICRRILGLQQLLKLVHDFADDFLRRTLVSLGDVPLDGLGDAVEDLALGAGWQRAGIVGQLLGRPRLARRSCLGARSSSLMRARMAVSLLITLPSSSWMG